MITFGEQNIRAVETIESMRFENVDFGYEGGPLIFENMTLDIPGNTNLLVTGAGGGGQSTLLKLLAVLVQPVSGSFLINGIDTTEMSFEEFLPFRRKIGYTFDYGGLFANRTISENLTLPLLYHKLMSPTAADEEAQRLAEEFNFMRQLHQRPAMVSGGLRKLTCVLRAFMMHPEMLVMDDPFTGIGVEKARAYHPRAPREGRDQASFPHQPGRGHASLDGLRRLARRKWNVSFGTKRGGLTMKAKFNKFERVAGLFVLSVILGSIAAGVGVAIKKGWFEPKVEFETTLKNAEGVRAGTVVQMAGIRAGKVISVQLLNDEEVHVRFIVGQSFHHRIHENSVVRAVRPFIIGEKVLDVSVGGADFAVAKPGMRLGSEATLDLMDLVNGKHLGPYVENMGKLMENLKYIAEAFLDPKRAQAIVKIFDELSPLVKNASHLARETTSLMKDVNRDKKVVRLIDNAVSLTDQTNKVLPVLIAELNKLLPVLAKDSPQLAEDLKQIAHNMAKLSNEMNKALPLLQQVTPEIPRTSKRAMEALDETVVTLKALQKSFLLRSNAREVREEEAARDRVPASNNEEKK